MATRGLNPQQSDFMKRYLLPDSETYRNAYASAKAAGYSETYAKSITDQAPWLSEILGKTEDVTVDEIIAGIKAETQTDRSADRLKAWELLGKHKKMFTDRVALENPDGSGLFGPAGLTIKVVDGRTDVQQ